MRELWLCSALKRKPKAAEWWPREMMRATMAAEHAHIALHQAWLSVSAFAERAALRDGRLLGTTLSPQRNEGCCPHHDCDNDFTYRRRHSRLREAQCVRIESMSCVPFFSLRAGRSRCSSHLSGRPRSPNRSRSRHPLKRVPRVRRKGKMATPSRGEKTAAAPLCPTGRHPLPSHILNLALCL